MSNLEFTAELTKRSTTVLGDESKAQAVLEEFEALDPREAQIIYRAFSHTPDSVEYAHTKARISALVASGKISNDLASLATMEQVTPVDETEADYMYSRMAAYAEMSLTENELLDPTGKITHMIERGDSKEKVFQALEQTTLYQSRKELLGAPIDADDFESQLAVFQFNELNDTLNAMLDPEVAPDFAANAKEAIAPYDEDGSIARLIDSGAGSADVFAALDFSDSWVEAYKDYATRDDVQTPRIAQETSWNTFRNVVNTIKDLDDN